MYELEMKLRFITKTEEQAENIRKLLFDLESMIECSSSYSEALPIIETDRN